MEGSVEVFLSWDVRNPSEVIHDESFIATSAEGVCGLYLPHPSEATCSGIIGQEDCERRKKRDADDDEDEAELYGTVTGLNPGMKNWYKLKVVEGWEDTGAASAVVVNVVGLVAAALTAFWMKL